MNEIESIRDEILQIQKDALKRHEDTMELIEMVRAIGNSNTRMIDSYRKNRGNGGIFSGRT